MILVTGNTGYIGSVMTGLLKSYGFKVVGLDSNFYEHCDFITSSVLPDIQMIKDVRDITTDDLKGVKAIIHLAALSNDVLGELNSQWTHAINYEASVSLAKLAKKVGVERFLFSSSCSLYGIADEATALDEQSILNPVTEYARTKVLTEEALAPLAADHFHPVFLRNATVYGVSPRMRLDLVVNNLTAAAFITGKVSILSDGTPWRPIIHVEDVCRAFMAILQAPTHLIHNQAFNVGINEETYRVKHIAQEVEKVVPNCRTEILNQTGADERTYRVDFSKIKKTLPNFQPQWNLRKGIEEVYQAFQKYQLKKEDFESSKFFRIKRVRQLIGQNDLDENLRKRRNVASLK